MIDSGGGNGSTPEQRLAAAVALIILVIFNVIDLTGGDWCLQTPPPPDWSEVIEP